MSGAAIREAIEHRDRLVELADQGIRVMLEEHCKSQPADQKKDVHTEHCCIIHGCKYGFDEDCTVAMEKLIQSAPCSTCEGF